MGNESQLVSLFFYGTLKRGHPNHDLYCGGALRVEEATARGLLYDLPDLGYPALVVPEEDARLIGTADPVHDAAEQRRLNPAGSSLPDGPRVYGELFTFDDPDERLPALDLLEGFDPERDTSPYRRALIPVRTTSGAHSLAWAYVVEASSGVHLPGGRWPS